MNVLCLRLGNSKELQLQRSRSSNTTDPKHHELIIPPQHGAANLSKYEALSPAKEDQE